MEKTLPEPKRYALLHTTPELLVELCKFQDVPKRMRVVSNAIPSDARFVRSGHDRDGSLLIVIESASFDPVPEGATLPMLDNPTWQIVVDEVKR